jgi:hypothetical protein
LRYYEQLKFSIFNDLDLPFVAHRAKKGAIRAPQKQIEDMYSGNKGEIRTSGGYIISKKKLKQPRKDLLFIGDSITDLWTYPAVYQKSRDYFKW